MLSVYEQQAWAEIHATLSARPGPVARWIELRLAPLDVLLERAAHTRLGEALSRATDGAMRALSGAAAASVVEPEICAALGRHSGVRLRDLREVPRLPLHAIDACTARLPRKYLAAGMVEGTATGALGVAGLLADVPILALLALRGVSETATYYGHDATAPMERSFMLHVLLAAAPAESRAAAEMSWLALAVSKQDIALCLARAVAGGAVERLAQAIGLRLARTKLVQLVPVVSAALAGGLNAWYLRRVLVFARALYRRRFLLDKHGALPMLVQP